jgi:hypothetical protein
VATDRSKPPIATVGNALVEAVTTAPRGKDDNRLDSMLGLLVERRRAETRGTGVLPPVGALYDKEK